MNEGDDKISSSRPRGLVSLWRVLSLLLLVAVFYFVGRQLGRDFRELRAQQIHVQVNWLYVVAALVCLMGARISNAVNTWLLLRALGAKLPAWKVVAIIWVSSLGRYIPGKVAVVAGSVAMLVRLGARFSVVGASLILSTAIMILIGMVGSIPVFFSPAMRERMPSAGIFGVMLAGMAVVCLYPPIFLAICNVGLRILKRDELPRGVRQGPFWGAVGVGVIRICFVSMSLWLAARSIALIGVDTIPQTVGAASLASVMGFIAVFAPAGLGVHEAVYLLALKPIMGAGVAILAIMFRGMQVGMDLLVAGIGAMIMRKESEASLAPTAVAEHG
ncbi:MAG TPA: lysylphosphatidylglycerol synthase transmembrane domain-containing protein [Tepidisphaeraceae bacterium]|nr:lysylphosphatidylglycerol synthase transmembrane domain-containing protein [Tepidisphaeraceae bacterium]